MRKIEEEIHLLILTTSTKHNHNLSKRKKKQANKKLVKQQSSYKKWRLFWELLLQQSVLLIPSLLLPQHLRSLPFASGQVTHQSLKTLNPAIFSIRFFT